MLHALGCEPGETPCSVVWLLGLGLGSQHEKGQEEMNEEVLCAGRRAFSPSHPSFFSLFVETANRKRSVHQCLII